MIFHCCCVIFSLIENIAQSTIFRQKQCKVNTFLRKYSSLLLIWGINIITYCWVTQINNNDNINRANELNVKIVVSAHTRLDHYFHIEFIGLINIVPVVHLQMSRNAYALFPSHPALFQTMCPGLHDWVIVYVNIQSIKFVWSSSFTDFFKILKPTQVNRLRLEALRSLAKSSWALRVIWNYIDRRHPHSYMEFDAHRSVGLAKYLSFWIFTFLGLHNLTNFWLECTFWPLDAQSLGTSKILSRILQLNFGTKLFTKSYALIDHNCIFSFARNWPSSHESNVN